jgi:dihydrofolate reductase
MGRRMADGGEVPWGDEPPFHAPVFVVTHRAHETLERKGGTSFTYVTDGLETAIDQARAAARGRTWRSRAVARCCGRWTGRGSRRAASSRAP